MGETDASETAARVLDSPRTAARSPAVGARPRRTSLPEDVASPGDPAADRADRAAKLRRRLLLRQPFPVAEQDHRPVFLRQVPHFLLDDRTEERLVELIGRLGHFDRLDFELDLASLFPPPLRRIDPGPGRNPCRDAVQPACDRIELANRPALFDQHQESGLERVVRIVRIAQNVAADAMDHWPVPGDQNLERRLGRAFARTGEALDQVPIGEPGHRPGVEQAVQVALQGCGRSTGHAPALPEFWIRSLMSPGSARSIKELSMTFRGTGQFVNNDRLSSSDLLTPPRGVRRRLREGGRWAGPG